MREGIKTSLLSLICGAAVSMGAFAAPSVRTIGGDNTYTSAAAATSSRAGSLRPTGTTAVKPSVSVSSTTAGTATNGTGTSTTGSVSNGGTVSGRVASAPRLSIGKYIGAPKSVSSTPSTPSGFDPTELINRIDRLETDVTNLESTKQDNMSGSDYIYIENNEIWLNLNALEQKLANDGIGEDGQTVEMGTNDTGLLWRYVGETDDDWRVLITWDAIREKLDLNGINQTINNLTTQINNKVDNHYDDPDAIGTALIVNQSGDVIPGGKFVNLEQGANNEGKILVVGGDGTVTLGDDQTGIVDTTQLATDLGLKALAYRDTVDTAHIDDAAVARAKLADEIASVISWIEWWKKNAPGDGVTINPTTGKVEGDGNQYVLSVDPNGNARWFQIVTAPESTETGTDETPTP